MRKNKLLLLLALLLTAATGAWAQETQGPWPSGDCTVTISGDVMTVSGTGAMANYKDSYALPWYGYDIKTIVIESGVTSIGKSAFAKCYNLESVSIPASVTSIGMQAFENCGYDATALTVSFAEGSTPLTISEYAFNDANLKSIDIPNRVTSIGNGAFASCSKLESVSIPASVTSIGNFAFQSCGSYAEALTVSFAEGSTLESIGESTFLEAKLTSINIPNSVTSIGTFAFSGCSNLESVSIPASVTSIGYNAFSSCSKLESVSIPASVTSISEGAFRYCGMLAKVYIYAPSLTTYGANAFTSNATGRKIYVLSDAVDTYKAGWSAYAADIEAMPATTKYTVTLAEGTKDAGNWSIEPKEGLSEGDQVTLQYTGRLKVKGVKATIEEPAKEPATVTTAPTGAAVVGVGKSTALVSGGVADGGTLMYAVTTTNTKPTSTDGFSASVPTAQTITASGTVYVWYYVKADDTHTDSEIAATAIEVPVADIVWDATNVSGLEIWGTEDYEVDGVMLRGNAENISAGWVDYGDPTTLGIVFEPYESGGYTFTAPEGKAFKKIVMKAQSSAGWNDVNLGDGWTFVEDGDNEIFTVTWKDSAASSVELLPDTDDFSGAAPVKSIAFYLSE